MEMINTKTKIRIMHVAECAGGVDRYLHSLIKYLDCEKFENILVCSQRFDAKDFQKVADYVEQIHMEHEIGKHDFKIALKVRKLIKKYHPDIVYAHSSKAGALVRMANVGLHNKCIYNPHGWAFNMDSSKLKKNIYKMMEKVMAPFCNKIICISDAERQSAIQNGICSDKKLQVIFNGIDIEEYETIKNDHISREDLLIPDDAFVVGSVGRLTRQKAPDVFIKMAHLIKEQIPNSYFIMVGNGELEDEVREYAESHNMSEALYITGWVDNPLSYVYLFDVATILSRWEGFGLVIPEYMICRKPVVATEVDAIPNILTDHVNGLLVPMDDAKAASEAILEIYKDINLRASLIKNGIEDVYAKYDAKRVAAEHGEIFRNLMK